MVKDKRVSDCVTTDQRQMKKLPQMYEKSRTTVKDGLHMRSSANVPLGTLKPLGTCATWLMKPR